MKRWVKLLSVVNRIILISLLFCAFSCRRAAESSSAVPGDHPTVASLVPAATDLLVQMGLSDHLVGISNYDNPGELGLAALPHVGDYQTIDWERLNQIRPDILIIFESPERVPAGLRQRANEMHMRLANVRTETIADIVSEARRLGELVKEPTQADHAIASFQSELRAIRRETDHLPRVRTLLVRDPATLAVVGKHNFLNDALEIAGGENVVEGRGWPNIDREMLQSLKPQAILVLSTENTPQALEAARQFLDSVKSPSCRTGIIAEWYAQQSSFYVARVAEQLAEKLHPAPSTTNPTEGRP